MWKQREYKDGEPELKEVILTFINVTNYCWDSEKCEEVSILTFECNEVQVS